MHQEPTRGVFNEKVIKSASSSQIDVPNSPISELLQVIENALHQAHEEFSMLDNKVEPIRASEPETVKDGATPRSVPPTQMEQRLQNIYDTARYLAARIEKTRTELRI